MSFFDCLEEGMGGGEIDKARGIRAQAMWKELSDQYEGQGHPRHNAEALAGEDVKEAFKREYGSDRHVFTARMANNRKLQAAVANTGDLSSMQTQSVERLDYQGRSLVRRFNARLGSFLKEHHRDLLGRVTKPAEMRKFVAELHGEATGDAAVQALAAGVRDALEDMRLMFNEAGGLAGKLDNWGLSHSHNRRVITKAGFEKWFTDIQPDINWRQVENFATGKPFQPEGASVPDIAMQRRFLKEIYDNLSYGKESREAVYGANGGNALYNSHSDQRVLHFNNADAWIRYNQKYGSGDPMKALMGHVHKMARDIVAMREFGPNPKLGVEYQQQLVAKRVRDEGLSPETGLGNGKHAARMFKVESGGVGAETLIQDYVSTFLSSTRHVLTSAFLDRAVVASISDVNTMRLAAQAMGMNPSNVLQQQVNLMTKSMTRDEAMRAGWVADTLADPGIALARFQSEVPPSEVAERLSSASMRVQGLSGWTDHGKIAFQMEISGVLASFARKKLSEIDHPIRQFLVDAGVTESDWAHFTNPEHLFTAGNGATFASPNYWRETTNIDPSMADDIFFKIQSMIEEQTEYAVPTMSLWARGGVDPAAFDMPPGTLPYEIIKSGLMFKSFNMTFTVNQIRRIAAQDTLGGKIGYGMNLAAGAALMGSMSLQIGELIKGNDPLDMTDPMFWGKSAMKGGSFGVIGDIVSTGQSSWGGGFGEYVAGPMPQALGDLWNLTIKNGYQLATGQDTNFAKELTTAGKRYTPMGQTPLAGPAIDRLFWDQLQLLLDPEAGAAISKKARARENRDGNDAFWVPGQAAPSRAPDFSGIFGGG